MVEGEGASDMNIQQRTYVTPLGTMLARSDGIALIGLDFADGAVVPASASRVLDALGDWLDAYFDGVDAPFGMPLAPQGTPFQHAVWEALRSIPYGATATYAEIARRIGRPTAMRAVGAANGRNPIAIVVPCHRVIGADGTLTGYAGGLERKRVLLALEQRSAFALVA
jgi:methylated-DNA-[protein]-cysteine S-methyltransferase